MLRLLKETAEVSSELNWVQHALAEAGFHIAGLEGYTIKDGRVSLLLDRRKVADPAMLTNLALYEVAAAIWAEEPYFRAKRLLAKLLGVDYFYVLYTNDKARVFPTTLGTVTTPSGVAIPTGNMPFSGFIGLLDEYRDLSMTKPFAEARHLPALDQALRAAGRPWPGNLDGLLVSSLGQEPRALIEFQTTNLASVRDHSNNRFIVSGADAHRFEPLLTMANQSGLPVLIIVWSPNDKDLVKVKQVVGADPVTHELLYSLVDIVSLAKLGDFLCAMLAYPVADLKPALLRAPPTVAEI